MAAKLRLYQPYRDYLAHIERGGDLPAFNFQNKVADVHFGELVCRVQLEEGGPICQNRYKAYASLVHHIRKDHEGWTVPAGKKGSKNFKGLIAERVWYDQFFYRGVEGESEGESEAGVGGMDLTTPIRRLVMVGACYVDTILRVPHFPQEDHKLRATSLSRRRGGNVANALEVLQQFAPLEDINFTLLCILPAKTSPGTEFVQASLDQKRVDTSHCIFRSNHQEPASSYIINSEESGSRTIVNYNELPEMTLEEFQTQVQNLNSEERTWFHFEGREVETSVACLQWLRREYPDVVLSVEVEKPNRPGLEKIAAEADVVFFSKTWAQAAGHENAESLLRAQMKELPRASLLCCTWGEEGAAIAGPQEGFLWNDRVENPPDFTVVDTIGAGDTWTAGMLYMLLSWDGAGGLSERARQAVTFANRLAGKKVAQQGFGDLGGVLE